MPHVVVLVVVVVVVLVVAMVAEVTGAPSASPARADVDEFLCASSISWAVAIGREGIIESVFDTALVDAAIQCPL